MNPFSRFQRIFHNNLPLIRRANAQFQPSGILRLDEIKPELFRLISVNKPVITGRGAVPFRLEKERNSPFPALHFRKTVHIQGCCLVISIPADFQSPSVHAVHITRLTGNLRRMIAFPARSADIRRSIQRKIQLRSRRRKQRHTAGQNYFHDTIHHKSPPPYIFDQ